MDHDSGTTSGNSHISTPMGASTRTGLAVLGAAAMLGVLGDALLRAGPWGINGTLWLAAFGVALVLLRRCPAPKLPSGDVAVATAALALGLAFAWRDSVALKLLNLAAVATIVALPFLRPLGARLKSASLSQLCGAGVLAGLHAAGGGVLLATSDIRWREVRTGRWSARVLAVARGIGIAVPLLVVFGALLVAADAVFARFVTEVFRIDLQAIVRHIIVTGFFAWLAGGVLRGMLLQGRVTPFWDERPLTARLGIVEVGIALGLLDLLFLSFVVVQVRYLYGGARYVASIPGLTYAEYARRGFFELVAVAALAVPLLVLAHWLLRGEGAAAERMFRMVGAAMSVLLWVIMASAVQRMVLYMEVYGLSELRLYTLAFMGWLAVVLLWFALTVLRGRRRLFAQGALAAGLGVIATLNVCNPDGLIAEVNLSRGRAGGHFDARYAAALSADAAPALVAGLSALGPEDRDRIIGGLSGLRHRLEGADWRTWSWSRARARRVLEQVPPVPLRPSFEPPREPGGDCGGRSADEAGKDLPKV